jgi:tetratricopeptide (TPR) repeat protein
MMLRAPILALAILVLSACSSPPSAKPDTDYVAMFNSGRYADAYDTASRAAGSLRGGNREMAALIAGQSAYRLGRASDAEKWLKPLLDSSSSPVAGRAAATLGSLALERTENRQAGELFKTAASKLSGDDSARALMYAGDALIAQGNKADAMSLYSQARDKVESDVQLRVQIGDRIAQGGPGSASSPSAARQTGPYTVQVAALSTRAAADKLARSVSHHGTPRVVPLQRNGKTLYSVRVGHYGTRAEADRVRTAIGQGAIVTTTGGE